MSGLIDAVRAKVSPKCLAGRCRKDGCRVSLENAPQPRLIIDFDKPGSPLGRQDTRCDYLFIAEGRNGSGWVAPLELKRGRLDAGEVVKQIQAGARAAEGLVPRSEPIKFRPVAASRGKHKAERDNLKKKNSWIRFHGRAEPIRLMSCGASLAQALGASLSR